MTDTANMNPGDIVALEYSQSARQRVVIGLNWDPRTDRAGLLEKIGGMGGHNVDTHDMDLACVMYGVDGRFIDGVSGRPEEAADQSGHIYHTGDDTTGTGDLDDEAISVEIKDFPADICHIVFVVEIQSKHTFDDVEEPTVRLADGKTDKNQFVAHMKGDKTAFVFGRIFRDGDVEDSPWQFHYIGDYFNGAEIADWVETLQKYVKK